MAFVCIIDDDASVRKSVASLLKSAGHTVASFPSGEAFLGADQPVPFTCILLDLKMKGLQGLDVQRILRERGTHTPIIFMSAHNDEAAVGRALAEGALDFLRKPFPADDLLSLVDEATRSGGQTPVARPS